MENRILVIDDSHTVRLLVTRALTQAGFAVIEACDGQDALQKVEGTAAVALVVCDVNMPIMNGLEFLEEFRKQAKNATVPVVMLTTEGHPELVQKAKSLGARGWIVKPFKAELLIGAVRKLTGVLAAAA